MENQNFKVSSKIVWILVIGGFIISFIAAFAKNQHWNLSQLLLNIALIFLFSAWIIVFSDILKNKIYNKTFWIISMIILPNISPLFYLIQRTRLLRLGNRF